MVQVNPTISTATAVSNSTTKRTDNDGGNRVVPARTVTQNESKVNDPKLHETKVVAESKEAQAAPRKEETPPKERHSDEKSSRGRVVDVTA